MSGLSTVSGIDASDLTAIASGATSPRRLSDFFADAVSVESFGAVGDGVTDDTQALLAAVASGKPVRLGARTYIVNGQFTIGAQGVALVGTPGSTTLRRLNQVGNGAWISIQGDRFSAYGIIFDANNAVVSQDSWGVFVSSGCIQTTFDRCTFRNASGPTLGSGLVFQSSDPAQCLHLVRDCQATGNANHGIWVQACRGVLVTGCLTYDNGGYGINVDFNDPTFIQKARLVQVIGNRSWGNSRGIGIGNFNQTNLEPPVWGNANPDAINVLVSGNICCGNTNYGIAASGQQLIIDSNLVCDNALSIPTGAGILLNASYSRVNGNLISGVSAYGIDAGGSVHSDIQANVVSGAGIGINCGGSTALCVEGNTLRSCTFWSIVANNVETDGDGNNFGISCSMLSITDNRIELSSANSGGVLLKDGPQGVAVECNDFMGGPTSSSSSALWPNTDSIRIAGNRWNLAAVLTVTPLAVASGQQLEFPDIADGFTITSSPTPVQAIVSSYQAKMTGQIDFVKVTAAGTGYTNATVSISGSGTGAAAQAILSDGAVIGVTMTSAGSAYGQIGTTVSVSISGDGSGATAIGYVSVPVCDGRRIAVQCNTPVRFDRTGSFPFQDNWTGTDLDAPSGTEVLWVAKSGHWQAARFVSADQISSDGSGATVVRSGPGSDVVLRPQGAGQIRLSSDTSLAGCVSTVGHGSPVGIVAAPPGSDYRNLDGGAGTTFWIKRSGTDATGWSGIA